MLAATLVASQFYGVKGWVDVLSLGGGESLSPLWTDVSLPRTASSAVLGLVAAPLRSVGDRDGGDQPTSMDNPNPSTQPTQAIPRPPASAGSRPSAQAEGRNSTTTSNTITTTTRAPRILIFRSSERPLSALSPFQRRDGCDRLGKILRCDRMRDGGIEVEFQRSEEATKALQATSFSFAVKGPSGRRDVSVPVTVEPHRTKNTSRGVINCFDLRDISDEEIADGLADFGVTSARRILTKRGTVKTDNVILTFDTTDLPNEVRVGYVKVRVRPYVPAPMRCYRCQRFGHTKDNCRGRPTCSKCASLEHTDDACESDTLRCVNCGEGQTPHSSYARSCPAYLKEKEINSIKATRNISFKEAREVYNQTHPKMSYAQTVKSSTTPSASLQQMSAAQLVLLLKSFGLTVVASVDTADPSARPAPQSDVTERAVPPSVPGAPAPPASIGSTEEEEGWTRVQRRHGGRRSPPPGQAAPAPARPRPPTAVQEALRRGQEERRASDARRTALIQQALEARRSPGADPAPAGSSAGASATSETLESGTQPTMGPPPLPPPRPPQRRPPPLLPTATTESQSQPAASTADSGQHETPPAPGRSAKRQPPWNRSPTEGENPRARPRLQGGSGHARSYSADGRTHREGSGHPRIQFGGSTTSDAGELV